MAKKNKQPEEAGGVPEWMATYGDLVTLLMCFFVLLFAFSTIDNKKFIEVMNSFQGGAGVLLSGTSIKESDMIFDGTPEKDVQKEDISTYKPVYIKVDKDTAIEDEVIRAIATNGDIKDAGSFKWQVSDEDVAEINQQGEIVVKKAEEFTVFALDKKSGVVGVYHINSQVGNVDVPELQNPSSWAKGELKKAIEMGVFPESLEGLDMQKPITRKEFAGIAVKVYEKLSDKTALVPDANPFVDTDDLEVLKSYKLGITKGVEGAEFRPDEYLDREQMATMLVRAYKKYAFKGWDVDRDYDYPLDISGVRKFKDDADISPWAKESVYFMVKNDIINGVGFNMFAPKSYTSEKTAQMYADSTREQAIIIGLRLVENLKKIQ